MHPASELVRALAQSETLTTIRQTLDPQRIVQEAISIQQIAAPTFAEEQRSIYVREQFKRYALADISSDDLFNVYGRWPGTDSNRPALLVCAHLDTVFPATTDLAVRHQGRRVYGAGLGDNSLGVASLLTLIRIFEEYDLRPPPDIWFVANSREEGLGDLGGIRAVWQRLANRLAAGIVLEGTALGRVYHAGIAVRRLRITCRAPGGHSWIHFGQPNAIHGLVQLGARIVELTPPTQPRTTYNIGLIEGGHSVNSLATTASFYLDLRSETPQTLLTFEQQIAELIDRVRGPDLSFEVTTVGDRPAGEIPVTHPLVQLATAALQTIDHPVTYEKGSTDANVLLANGLPTVTVGITYGRHAHRLDEYIETDPIADGIWQALLLVLSAAEQAHTWRDPS
jgi:tripeptide aminopeptidase